ncbi:hypothetical protein COLO4_07658 [Corchorus olitorius]|uniref:Uncharacterized protein n=1 Tax=Corchorus olitorius TaxID=93759 RepID=A0A1R3KIY8_9ROSI|nr:hypothetical protein COLO4_07658 [Corchorus olitorius]
MAYKLPKASKTSKSLLEASLALGVFFVVENHDDRLIFIQSQRERRDVCSIELEE